MAGLDRYWANKLILLKSEVTAGVDSLPVVASNSLLAYNMSLTLDADEKSRNPDKGYYAAPEKTFTNKRFSMSFDIELAGSGTAGTAPAIADALIMCGMLETVVPATSVAYTPVSGSDETATIYLNIDGTLFKILGAKGTLTINPAIGDYTKATVNIIGFYLAPSDVALTPGDFSGFVAPVDCTKEECELSIDSVLVDGVSFNLTQNNTNEQRESTETKVIANLNRQPSGEMVAWINPQATFNPYSLFEDHSKVPVYWISGTTAGNIVKIDCPNAQLGAPQVTDSNGVAAYTIPFTPHSTSAGDDEFSITFT